MQQKNITNLLDDFLFTDLYLNQNEYVKEIFDKLSKSFVHNPVYYNLSEGIWLKHPVQFNLFPLPNEEKIKTIKGSLEINKNKEPQNFRDRAR